MNLLHNATTWLGTPFHAGAAIKGVGCDCFGLIAALAAEAGGPTLYPLPFAYTTDKFGLALREADFLSLLALIAQPVAAPEVGDVLSFKGADGVQRHCAFLFPHNQLLHSVERHGVCLAPYSARWQARFAGGWRLKK
jgi:cell wall-associated NlpC family hydrolase